MLWRYHYAMTPPPIRHPVRIIGIDPGLRRTGWGVIETEGNRLVFVGCGSVEPPDDLPLANRLLAIHEGLAAVLGVSGQWRPRSNRPSSTRTVLRR
jgi:crossover junction endodeoxyribonuclease RuvC